MDLQPKLLRAVGTRVKEVFAENLKEYLSMRQLYAAAIKEIRTKLEILDEEFSVLHDHNPIHHIESRMKSPESIMEKLKRKNLPVTLENTQKYLYDVAGVRVICNYIEDVYRIADLLIAQDDLTPVRRRDYIKDPKENGYRSLHIVVSVPIFLAERTVPVNVEVQIRTIAMDFWASLEHQLRYKTEKQVPTALKDKLKNCAQTITDIDMEMQSIYNQLKEGKSDDE